MANVVILKQPLYGTITWNGYDFDYVPTQGYSTNDVYIYSKSVNGFNKIFTQYVNPSNTPPVAKTIATTTDAFQTKEFTIADIVTDTTQPFGDLTIVSVSGAKYGIASTDGSKIYYVSNKFNNIEYLVYTVSDKQFTTSGTITLSVINGYERPIVVVSPLTRMYEYRIRLNQTMYLSTYWTGASEVLDTYGAFWDSIDTVRYGNFCDVVLSGYYIWNPVYDNSKRYDNKSTVLCTYSAEWDSSISEYFLYRDPINEGVVRWNNEYSILTANSGKWNDMISNFDNLTSSISSNQDNYNNSYVTTQTNSGDIWDSTELNAFSSNYTDTYNNIYEMVFNDNTLWTGSITKFQELSTDVCILTSYINETLNTVSSNSGSIWDTTELNSISSIYFDNLNNVYTILTSNSSNYTDTQVEFSLISANIHADYDDITVLTNLVSSVSSTLWDTLELYTNLSSNSGNWEESYNNLVENYGIWNQSNELSAIIDNDKPIYDSVYTTVSSNSAIIWDNTNTTSITLNNSGVWDSAYTTLTTNSGIWNQSNELSAIIDNDRPNYDSVYSVVATNSAIKWNFDDLNLTTSINSGNWGSMYDALTSNYTNWNQTTNLSSIIDNDKPTYNSVYSTVTTNSAIKWNTDDLNSIAFGNSANWSSMYDVLTSNYSKWHSVSSLSSVVSEVRSHMESLYGTIDDNVPLKWNGLSVYQSVSGEIEKFEQLRYILSTLDLDTNWNNVILIYNQIYDNYSANYPYLENTTNTVNSNYTFWDTTYITNILSELSSNWVSLYNTLTELSSYWKFDETDNLKQSYSIVSANSGNLNNTYSILTSNTDTWNNIINNNDIISLSTQYLTGNEFVSLSTKDLIIYGNLNAAQNISAIGSSTKINTSNYTVSAIEIANNSESNCFIITKSSGYNNIATFIISSYPALWIKANNTVSINLTGGTESLNVFGNISATGYVYPYLSDVVTSYKSNSAKYEAAYTFLTSNSANLADFVSNKTNYDNLINYVQSSTSNINELTSSKPKFDNIFNTISSQYNNNLIVNNFINLSGSLSATDSVYPNNTARYDTTYNILTTVSAGVPVSLNYLFSFSPNTPIPHNVKFQIGDNIRLTSWTIVSDTASDVTVDILSGYTTTNYRLTSITNSNYIKLSASGDIKNTNDNLSSKGWTTYITKGSVVVFNLTQNTSANSIMINLKGTKL